MGQESSVYAQNAWQSTKRGCTMSISAVDILPPAPPSTNSDLKGLFLTAGNKQILDLEPLFTPDWQEYTVRVKEPVETVVVVAVPVHEKAQISITWSGEKRPTRYTDSYIEGLLKPGSKGSGGGGDDGVSGDGGGGGGGGGDHGGGGDSEAGDETTEDTLLDTSATGSNETVVSGLNLPPPKPGWKVPGLKVGQNQLTVVVTAEDRSTREFIVKIERMAWDPDGWKPGSLQDKYMWYRRGADQGYATAQHRLALMYAGEDGQVLVPESGDINDPNNNAKLKKLDPEEAKVEHYKYLVMAAHQGFVPAQFRLASSYFNSDVPAAVHFDDLKRHESKETAMKQKQAGLPDALAGAGLGMQLVSLGGAAAESPADDLIFDDQDHWKQAHKWFTITAEQGEVRAMHNLALMHVHGQGCELSYKEALNWFIRAGKPRAESEKTVAKLLEKLAQKGDKVAAYEVGVMHLEGIGVPKSYMSAFMWLKKSGEREDDAAKMIEASLRKDLEEKKDKEAAFQLALMYRDGVGVEMDYVQVLRMLAQAGKSKEWSYQQVQEWFSEAAQNGNKDAMFQLALTLVDGIGAHMDFQAALDWLLKAEWEAKEAEDLVAKRFGAAAQRGNPKSCYQLALMYVKGIGVKMDYKTALYWLEKAGTDHEQANQQAVELFGQSAGGGDVRAAFQMALMYIDGVGVPIDYFEAFKWLQKAGQPESFAQRMARDRLAQNADGGNREAAAKLAEMYMDYENTMKWLVEQDKPADFFYARAAKWFEVAANAGDMDAAEKLGEMYMNWKGVPIDFKQAEYWFMKGGKNKSWVRKRVNKKLQTLKKNYKRLFRSLDKENKGEIDLNGFKAFYRECMIVTGMNERRAHERTVSVYQARTKYEILFNAMDADKNRTIDFEEIWTHPHTHTSLFPKTGKHVMAALTYFEKFNEEHPELLPGGKDDPVDNKDDGGADNDDGDMDYGFDAGAYDDDDNDDENEIASPPARKRVLSTEINDDEDRPFDHQPRSARAVMGARPPLKTSASARSLGWSGPSAPGGSVRPSMTRPKSVGPPKTRKAPLVSSPSFEDKPREKVNLQNRQSLLPAGMRKKKKKKAAASTTTASTTTATPAAAAAAPAKKKKSESSVAPQKSKVVLSNDVETEPQTALEAADLDAALSKLNAQLKESQAKADALSAAPQEESEEETEESDPEDYQDDDHGSDGDAASGSGMHLEDRDSADVDFAQPNGVDDDETY